MSEKFSSGMKNTKQLKKSPANNTRLSLYNKHWNIYIIENPAPYLKP